jgi:hypothetical protein
LTNDEESQRRWSDRAEELLEDSGGDVDDARRELADELKNDVTEGNPVEPCGLYFDLLQGAISEIDFREIADTMLSGVESPAEE